MSPQAESIVDDTVEAVIAAGPFLMGRPACDLFADPVEQPARIVTLSAFAIDVYPVTNRRYRAFVAAQGYERPELWSAEGWRWVQREQVRQPRSFERADLAGEDQPVCGISWYEAAAFAAFEGRRLPTSAEWERAARGLDGRRFPWGDQLPSPSRCNYDGLLERTAPVGSYPRGVSPCGLHDCAGNVNNWVADVYWSGFGAWCVEQGLLHDPCLTEALATRLGRDPRERTDRGGGFLTASARFEVLATTFPLGWPASSRELWHGARTARSLEGSAGC